MINFLKSLFRKSPLYSFNFQYRVMIPLFGGYRSTGIINVSIPATNERQAKKLLKKNVEKTFFLDFVKIEKHQVINKK